jgi:hypothetical protein
MSMKGGSWPRDEIERNYGKDSICSLIIAMHTLRDEHNRCNKHRNSTTRITWVVFVVMIVGVEHTHSLLRTNYQPLPRLAQIKSRYCYSNHNLVLALSVVQRMHGIAQLVSTIQGLGPPS